MPTRWRREYAPRVRLACLILLASCSSTPDALALHETFDTGTDGWSLQGFNTDSGDYTVMPQLHADALWDASDAALQRHDLVGVTDYFQAAAPFAGNLSAYADGSLSYRYREASTDQPFDAPLVILEGAGVGWRFTQPQASSTGWFDVEVPLAFSSHWTRVDGTPATADALHASLANVTALWLRGEFSSAFVDGWIDDITLVP